MFFVYTNMESGFEFVFLGTGTSGCVPEIACLLPETPTCKVCLNAIKQIPNALNTKNGVAPTLFTKDRRRNTSGLLRIPHNDGRIRNIVIDCGKTFYESALTWFVQYGYQRIDAVILTHGHADAMMGTPISK